MKKILCTLFAAAVIAATSAVTAFAEDNLIFIKTAPTPKEVTEFAENIFKESESRLIGVGLTETEAKSAILGNSFIINDDDKPDIPSTWWNATITLSFATATSRRF
ncbi:MAG: hypothetical protein K2H90_02535 [Oscillospiraceae bacterium]|nr:hypothetical protein [Oscillospiraceae bacterium]